MQTYLENRKYMVKTKFGWENFEGIVKTVAEKEAIKLTYVSGNDLICTLDHRVFTSGGLKRAENILIGEEVLTIGDTNEIVTSIEYLTLDTVYDIFNSDSHSIIANTTHTHQCDELAFVQRRIALEFWTSVFPTLSCLSGDTYVLNSQDGYRRIDSYLDSSIEYNVGEYYSVLCEDTWGIDGIEELSHLYISPESDTLKITTESGFKVEVTLNHPLYTQASGMVKANELKIGDKLLVNYGMHCYGRHVIDIDTLTDTQIRELISTDTCMQLNRYSTERLIDRLFGGHSNSLSFRDYSTIYRLKLILSNMGYRSTVWAYADMHNITFDYIEGNDTEYEPIRSIVESTQPLTYDFTVPNSHTFLQNGIIGSNTGGSCIITSTPTDDETLFANIWKDAERTFDEHGIENPDGIGINGFKSLRVKWDAHPERDETFKTLNIRQFGEEKFQREHELEFVAESETLLAPLHLKQMDSKEPLYTTEQSVRWYKEPSKEFLYFIALDPSMGTGGDNAAIQVFEFPSMVQVAEWMHNKSDPSIQIRVMLGILNGFRDAGFDEDNVWWSFENNGCGETINMYLREVEDETEIFGTLIKEQGRMTNGRRPRKGLLTTNQVKSKAFSRMKLWIERDIMTINSKPLIKEFKTFVRSGATYRAMLGEKDDLVLAVMLVARMIERAMGERDEYMEELGVARDIIRMSEGRSSDDDDNGYFPLPVG